MADYQGVTLAAMDDAARYIYQSGMIPAIYTRASKNLAQIFQPNSDYDPGGKGQVIHVESRPAGSFIATGERGRFPGRDASEEEGITTTEHASFTMKRRYFQGIVEATYAALWESNTDPGGSRARYLVKQWMRDAQNVIAATGDRFATTLFSGAKGYIFKLAQSSPISSETLGSNGRYSYVVDISQDSDRRFQQLARNVPPNTPIQIVDLDDDSVVTQTGAAEGVIRTARDNNTIVIELFLNRRLTNLAAFDDGYAIRFQKRHGETDAYDAYGLWDIVNDSTADFGANDDQFPYLTGDTGFSPTDDFGEWASPLVTGAGKTIQDAIDELFLELHTWSGVDPDETPMLMLTTKGVAQYLVREQQVHRRYAATDPNDMRSAGYDIHVNGALVKTHRCCPLGTLYALTPESLMIDNMGAGGPFWLSNTMAAASNTGARGGNLQPVGSTLINDGSRSIYYAVLAHYYQRATNDRQKNGVITGLSDNSGVGSAA